MSRQIHLQRAMNKLNVDDSMALMNAFAGDATVAQCHRARVNPLNYLSKSFKYAVTLLSVMFDTGCVISGSRALDFFVPGSANQDSDWDFYVPGYKESVADMIHALTLCGVTWGSNVDLIATDFLRDGRVEVSSSVLQALSSWLSPDLQESILGDTVHEILTVFTRLRNSIPDAPTYIISRASGGDIVIKPNFDEGCHVEDVAGYESSSGEQFSMICGSIETPQGNQSVQLIIGCHYHGVRSCLSFIKDFYASHVQCFIGGWCAAHMYYYHATSKEATVWERKRTKAVDRAIEKYRDRGFSFRESTHVEPIIRRLDDMSSVFLDYGDIYRPFLCKWNVDMFDRWLADRRQNIEAIHWLEFGTRIEALFSPLERCSRNRASFADAKFSFPVRQLRRLSDVISLNASSSGRMRTKDFSSSVRKTLAGTEWHVKEAIKSGMVYNSLQDASPWSWTM